MPEFFKPTDNFNTQAFNGLPISNQNILDNWYFIGGGASDTFPINQRGQISYIGSGYGIDRWKLLTDTSSITIGNSGITITENETSATNVVVLRQVLYTNRIIAGAQYTFSALVDDISDKSNWLISVGFGNIANTSITGTGLFSVTVTAQSDLTSNYSASVYFWKNSSTSDTITIRATKLELGSTQTLAYQDPDGTWKLNDPPPNFQQELEKCHRYCYNPLFESTSQYAILPGYFVPNSETEARLVIVLPTPMRTTPTLSVSGQFYANGSGNLGTSSIPVTLSADTYGGSTMSLIAIPVNSTDKFDINVSYMIQIRDLDSFLILSSDL